MSDPEGGQGQAEDNEKAKGFWEQAREAKANSDGWMSYFFTMATVMSITACGTCLMVIALLIPIFAFIIGITKYDECPVNPMIPVYLIVIGIIGVISSSLGLWRQCNATDMKTIKCVACLQIPVTLVWFIFFVAGTIWVYGSFSEVDTENKTIVVKGADGEEVRKPNEDYCHPWVYWLAFFMITVVYVILLLTCIIICAAACLMSRLKPSAEETPINPGEQQQYNGEQQPPPAGPPAEAKPQENN